jgi:tRNA nucleotidyltransferase (CCA-adding enzyme)
MAQPSASQFPHGADIGIRGVGATRSAAFEQAALALAAAVTDPATVRTEEMVAVECDAPDDRLLLCDWLNALIYEMAVRHMVFGRFEVALNGPHLTGRAWGEAVDRARHAPAAEPKGATLSGIRVAQQPDGAWIAECIIDV